jgi:Ca2+/H+ antiporter
VPEDLADLAPDEQQRRIKMRAMKLMLAGTIVVIVVSDAMVDVLAELGDVVGVPAFYVSFILAPLASNASELIASYNYAIKKTTKTITIRYVWNN